MGRRVEERGQGGQERRDRVEGSVERAFHEYRDVSAREEQGAAQITSI
jgi:hypothetical protein